MGVNLQLLSEVKPEVYGSYIFYAVLSIAWMMLKIPLTTYHRITKQVFANPEDKSLYDKPIGNHSAVERVTRMLHNDIENIVPFCILGLFYCWTTGHMVAAETSIWVFRAFFVFRVLTSFCHYLALMPHRTITWLVATGCNLFLLYQLLTRIMQFGLKYA